MYFSHFLSSLPWFSLFSFRTLRARYASLPLRVKSGGSYTHELWASSAKMKSCRRCDFTHYLFSFPPWETLNLHDLNNSITACHHTHRLSWILSVYPKKTHEEMNVCDDFLMSDCSQFSQALLVHRHFPGNRHVHLFFHLCFEIHYTRLWNIQRQNHVPIDPLPLISLHLIISVSPFLLAVHWVLVNPVTKRKHHFVRLLMQMMQQAWNGKAHRCH